MLEDEPPAASNQSSLSSSRTHLVNWLIGSVFKPTVPFDSFDHPSLFTSTRLLRFQLYLFPSCQTKMLIKLARFACKYSLCRHHLAGYFLQEVSQDSFITFHYNFFQTGYLYFTLFLFITYISITFFVASLELFPCSPLIFGCKLLKSILFILIFH